MIGNKGKFANSRPTEEEKEESGSSKSGGWPVQKEDSFDSNDKFERR